MLLVTISIFISDDLTSRWSRYGFLLSRMVLLKVGTSVDQPDQRFPVQDRQYLFAKFNVDEMRKDITKG